MPPDLKIVFQGIPPSKKNSKKIMYMRGKPIIVSSDSHKAWHTENMWLLKKVKAKFVDPVKMKCTFFPKDKRAHDSTNVVESINDILVDAGIIKDDNWFLLPDIHLLFGGVDPQNPRVEVEITL